MGKSTIFDGEAPPWRVKPLTLTRCLKLPQPSKKAFRDTSWTLWTWDIYVYIYITIYIIYILIYIYYTYYPLYIYNYIYIWMVLDHLISSNIHWVYPHHFRHGNCLAIGNPPVVVDSLLGKWINHRLSKPKTSSLICASKTFIYSRSSNFFSYTFW